MRGWTLYGSGEAGKRTRSRERGLAIGTIDWQCLGVRGPLRRWRVGRLGGRSASGFFPRSSC
jgi:hypothetical protein